MPSGSPIILPSFIFIFPAIIVETGVEARELECAVLGNDLPKASIVGEITYESDFYDYETKYAEGKADLLIPARVSKAIATRIQEMATQAFLAVDAAGLARVDFFYVEKTATQEKGRKVATNCHFPAKARSFRAVSVQLFKILQCSFSNECC